MSEQNTSEAKNVPTDENPTREVKSNLLAFELPDVTETAGDFQDVEETTTQDDTSNRDSQPGPEDYRGTPDKKGNPYDPAIHAYPPDMTGKLGKWKRKPKAEREQKPQEPNAQFRQAAQNWAVLYANMHRPIFKEHAEIDKDALMVLTDSLENYFMSEGIKEMNPKAGVLVGMMNYTGVIVDRPPNKEKVLNWAGKLKNTILSLLGKKPKIQEQKTNAHTDSGT